MDSQAISRRQFLIDAGTLTTGFVAGAGIVSITACAPQEIVKEVPKEVIKQVVKEVPKWPWPYAKLDPELVREKGQFLCFQCGCGYGGFAAIIEALREKVGFPYTQILG